VVSDLRKRFCFEPIGYVLKGLPKDKSGGIVSRFQFVSEIYVYDKFKVGLKGLENFSHIYVIWVIDRQREVKLVGHPHGDSSAPLVGIFATRSPNRPTPIGLTVVELINVENNVVRVKGLDAWTDSPVLDIKPYDYYDHVNDIRVPSWFLEHWNRKNRELNYKKLVPWLGPIK